MMINNEKNIKSFCCRIPTRQEVLKKYDYEISIHPGEEKNWISWKQEYMNMPEGKRISYFGFLDDEVICEATAALSSDACMNMENLVNDKTAYLFAFRTNVEYRGQGYFSKLFKFMINDLKTRGYEQVIIGVDPTEYENKEIYFHYGFNELVKTDVENNPDGSLVTVEYYKKYL